MSQNTKEERMKILQATIAFYAVGELERGSFTKEELEQGVAEHMSDLVEECGALLDMIGDFNTRELAVFMKLVGTEEEHSALRHKITDEMKEQAVKFLQAAAELL